MIGEKGSDLLLAPRECGIGAGRYRRLRAERVTSSDQPTGSGRKLPGPGQPQMSLEMLRYQPSA